MPQAYPNTGNTRRRGRFTNRRPRSGRHFKAVPVWFARIPKILFNPRNASAMTNEPFSPVLPDGELEFSGRNLLNPKEERFEVSGQTGRPGFG